MFQTSNTFNGLALLILGEEIVVDALKMAKKFLTQTDLSITTLQACDDHYLFVQSSNLDIVMEKFDLPYDPDRLRGGFHRHIERRKSI